MINQLRIRITLLFSFKTNSFHSDEGGEGFHFTILPYEGCDPDKNSRCDLRLHDPCVVQSLGREMIVWPDTEKDLGALSRRDGMTLFQWSVCIVFFCFLFFYPTAPTTSIVNSNELGID